MIDEILTEIFGEALLGRAGRSRRFQLLARVFFGLLGALLGVAGAVYLALRSEMAQNLALQATMILVFVFLSCFALFNVALARQWRWPGRLFVLSFVGMFVVRIVFGN
jgi:hypothetical protein